MKILVFEYITGGGFARAEPPPSLVVEGDLMLHALVTDLAAVDGVEVAICRDIRLDDVALPCAVYTVTGDDELHDILAGASADADAVWPIAPETNGALESVSEQVLNMNRLLLGSRPEGIRVAASKRDTAQRLATYGLPVVPVLEPHPALFDQHPAWVVKPDDGVGCDGARICRSAADLMQTVDAQPAGRVPIAQPFIHGASMSLSMLCRDGRGMLLCCNRQRVAIINDEFHLLGCIANDDEGAGAISAELVDTIAAAIPGLWGYAGVDLMLTRDGPQILEVNPRLTLSYVGLKRALGINPAKLVLDLLDGDIDVVCDNRGRFAPLATVHVDLESVVHAGQ